MRKNSVNRRARIQFGTDRLVKSVFHDEKSVQKRIENRKKRLRSKSEWDRLTPEQRKKIIINKYGPGKKHNHPMILVIHYSDINTFNKVISRVTKWNNREIHIEFTPVEDLWYRFGNLNSLIITDDINWYFFDINSYATKIIPSKESTGWKYSIRAIVYGNSRSKRDPLINKNLQFVGESRSNLNNSELFIDVEKTIYTK